MPLVKVMGTKKKSVNKNPNAKANRIITRVSNADMHVILRNALTHVAGENPRGKLGRWIREAAIHYRPTKKIGPK